MTEEIGLMLGIAVVNKTGADLDGTTFAYDCRMRLCSARYSRQAKIINNSSFQHFDCGYDCHGVLNMFQKPTTFSVLCATVVKMLYV